MDIWVIWDGYIYTRLCAFGWLFRNIQSKILTVAKHIYSSTEQKTRI